MTEVKDTTKIGHGKPGPGRPRSTKSKQERLFDRLMNSRGDNLTRLVDATLKMAEAGEQWAVKAIMDRCFPVKGRTITGLNLSGADPVGAVDRILKSIDDGNITPEEAKSLLDVVRAKVELVKDAELEARLAKLESGAAE
jgi:hypothetical protein